MKKFLFLFVSLFCIFSKVNAEIVLSFDIVEGDIYSSEDILDVVPNYTGTATSHIIHVAYYDSDDNLLNAFTASNGMEFTYSGDGYGYDYDNDMFLWEKVDFNFGDTCIEAYSKLGEEYIEWCNNYLNMYTSSKDYSNIKYWQIESVGTKKLSEFCNENSEVQNSFSCNQGIDGESMSLGWWGSDGPDNYDYYSLIVIKEYAPVSFELVCEPKEVKKGETSNCELKVNASEEINELTIPVNSDLFDITKYNEVEGWELVDNKDGTITIKSEDGFKGEGVVLDATLKFKENLTDDVEIELSDIHYITADGIELNGNAKDNITIYEEPVVEDSKEEVEKNPETIGFTPVGSLLILLLSLILLIVYRKRVNEGM